MGLQQNKVDGTFANVLSSDGSIRVQVEEGTPGSIKREWETQDGKKGTKFEMKYSSLTGMITDIRVHESEYGKSLHVMIEDNNEIYVLSTSLTTNFATDILRKLPSINFTKNTRFQPFNFISKQSGKTIKGMNITQDDKKIEDFFKTRNEKGEIKNINGMPDPDGDKEKYDKDDWKIYYMKVTKFLINYMEENIKSNLSGVSEQHILKEEEGLDPDIINLEDTKDATDKVNEAIEEVKKMDSPL